MERALRWPPLVRTLCLGLSTSAEWAQVLRFTVVNASGCAVNLAVYALGLTAGVNFRLAASSGRV
jgi:hypothetical protein